MPFERLSDSLPVAGLARVQFQGAAQVLAGFLLAVGGQKHPHSKVIVGERVALVQFQRLTERRFGLRKFLRFCKQAAQGGKEQGAPAPVYRRWSAPVISVSSPRSAPCRAG